MNEEAKAQRSNRLIISALVLFMGLVILAPQAFTLFNHYFKPGEIHTATYTNSAKVSNTKDTVMIPHYTFTRLIGPVQQTCTLPMPRYIHALEGKPIYERIRLKIGETCQDFIDIQDVPYARLILFMIGALLTLTGLWLFKKAVHNA